MNEQKPKAPDGGYGWVILLAGFGGAIIHGSVLLTMTLMYQALLEKFEMNAADTGALGAVFGPVLQASSPVVSLLSRVLSLRVLIVSGGFLYSSGLLLAAFAVHPAMVTVGYGVISGFAANLFLFSYFLILTDYFDKRRSLAFGVFMAGMSIGGLVMPPVFSFWLSTYGYTGALMLMAGFVLNLVPIGLMVIPLETTSMTHKSGITNNHIPNNHDEADQACQIDDSTLIVQQEDCRETYQAREKDDSTLIAQQEDCRETYQARENDDSTFIAQQEDGRETYQARENDASTFIAQQEDGRETYQARENDDSTFIAQQEDGRETYQAREKDDSTFIAQQEDGRETYQAREKDDSTFIVQQEDCRELPKTITQNRTLLNKASAVSHALGLHHLKSPVYVTYVILICSLFNNFFVGGFYMSGVAKEKANLTNSEIALIITITSAADIGVKVLLGFVLDTKLIRKSRPIFFVAMHFFNVIAALYIAMFVDSFVTVCVGWMFFFSSSDTCFSQMTVLLSDLIGSKDFASALGLARLFEGVWLYAGIQIAGQLTDWLMSYVYVFYYCAGLNILCGIIFLVTYCTCHNQGQIRANKGIKIDIVR